MCQLSLEAGTAMTMMVLRRVGGLKSSLCFVLWRRPWAVKVEQCPGVLSRSGW